MLPVNLHDLTSDEFKSLFKSLKFVLFDNDGVLSLFGELLPGSKDVINKLNEIGKTTKVITNNTAFGRSLLCKAYVKQGVVCKPDLFLTPTCAMIDYLKKLKFHGKVWVNGSEPQLEQFKEAGLKLATNEEKRIFTVPEGKTYYEDLDPEVNAIVVDLDFNMNYLNIAKVVKYLHERKDMLYIVGGTDKLIPIGRDSNIIGTFHIQNLITGLTKEPVILGKPSLDFGKFLISVLGCRPSETLFVGDSLEHDIGFAKQMGFHQLLVLSGQTKIEHLRKCNEAYKPQYYINNVEELNALLEKYS